ncbi:hypothetical protein GCM10025865_05890 [Paraoerskovia sediminicola]|uniref:2-succinyl-5-enolpyruvyl-6-hydroxy-3-cyclohexene-1-carboxylate synthase n=1 Tax=Paraoerskovia sediminicola TaxID=1138587 RepID=A0ABM8G087_9CELL|nr:hypothetical protein GCM10025865_05890 [Paraoerskovia sediminicola]
MPPSDGPPVVEVPDDVAHLVRVGPDEPPTVVVAGDGAGAWVRGLAENRGWPVLAEPSSGATGGPHQVCAYRLLLDTSLAGEVRRVVVVGRPTLSRPVQRLLGRPEVTVLVVAPGAAPWVDPGRVADVVLPGRPSAWSESCTADSTDTASAADSTDTAGTADTAGTVGAVDATWCARWVRAGRRASEVVADELAREPRQAGDTGEPLGASGSSGLSGLGVARAVAASTSGRVAGQRPVLIVGSSNPVRDLDLVTGIDAVGAEHAEAPLTVVANRGLAGIDGVVSTATGVALSSGRPTTVLLGDLTFLHDIGGLLRGAGEPAPDLRVVVVNDDGGSIFATLEQGALAARSETAAARFERVFATPTGPTWRRCATVTASGTPGSRRGTTSRRSSRLPWRASR